ncbi:MAG: MGH1-like glycoside hydrolase domain-containing protein [Sulfurifustaceae bacterium]
MSAEQQRLEEARDPRTPWKKWGPYLSERQWGTVREDYSTHGDAWNYFPHDHARSRAYRWGEDGIAGVSDDKQLLCFALALWNGEDPILKERLFGLTNNEGNHGEDVKEYYFYIDSTPTHSYMKYLYKYPHAAYPYTDLLKINRWRSRDEFEYELLDTGLFNEDRYFDVFVEYAKESPEDLLIQITVHNRGPEKAALHVLPTLWFRNTWSWGDDVPRPTLRDASERGRVAVEAKQEGLGEYYLYADDSAALLFTENETNSERLFGQKNSSPYVKDGINDAIVKGQTDRVNPQKTGTKAAAHFPLEVAAGKSQVVRLRLTRAAPSRLSEAYGSNGEPFGRRFEEVFARRRNEADEFYTELMPKSLTEDGARVVRQALAGMMWGKQFYFYDLHRWLREHGSDPLDPTQRRAPRNDNWFHMTNADIISMPDKWEYPWYAAWDLGFHVTALTLVDSDFAKQQLELILRDRYIHPSGQVPAYEWNFADVNPPVHAWAAVFTARIDYLRRGEVDVEWAARVFDKLLMNFTWWVNRKDRDGRNVFEGGFLGLDNISVFDRSSPLPTGGYLQQADGTAWMAFYCQTMAEVALFLTRFDPARGEMALKFVEHFLWIASAMMRVGDAGMWDEEDGFFYDVLRLPDGRSTRLKVRSLVGLLPMCAATVIETDALQHMPEVIERFREFLHARPELIANLHDLRHPGYGNRRLLAIVDEKRLRRMLRIMLDENEFLSPYGIRSISKIHATQPYVVNVEGNEYRVDYLPAESNTGMYGGNSNWRGPIWMPTNALIVRSLLHYYQYYGDDFRIECPTGSGRYMTLYEVAQEITRRLSAIFLRGPDDRRPVYGGAEKLQKDPHWRDYILFYEYFHGDNGAGLGASHQTGWTGCIATLMCYFALMTPERMLAKPREKVAGPPEQKEAVRAR